MHVQTSVSKHIPNCLYDHLHAYKKTLVELRLFGVDGTKYTVGKNGKELWEIYTVNRLRSEIIFLERI